ncbi:Gfo/Idh/MocA family oxidoreductase [Aquirufa nivalisilvae]
MNNKVLLVGSGFMAKEYLLVLRALNKIVIVVGRGKENIELLQQEFPEFTFHYGGLEKYLKEQVNVPEFAINASSINQLAITTKQLMLAGVKSILLEKPGDLNLKGLVEIEQLSQKLNIQVYIAYNRRFYSSIQKLKDEVLLDGGIQSAHFEFTEWAHTIDQNKFDSAVLNKWIISNSSHVIDTVFYLIGKPQSLQSLIKGQGLIPWHASGSVFIGMGISTQNIPFSYHANWGSAGRWSIEISTLQRRFYLKPMEKLSAQKLGAVSIEEIQLDNTLDLNFKPGLFVQVDKFLKGQNEGLCTIEEQKMDYQDIYMKIGAYEY